ncbi:peptide/nickel transport system permease protein [Friedmanniella endophytica]|uniref:Peptide/nickel transport system permease protein n=1 Tax=Microlunatus kandeliicorticis TaxID=1759536 RepID=A0A7W3IPS5_9ACTN|nr:ABC transporter permease [Microlunatus kandeliicorticis]MBA8792985.1 peptide/nickel transport system permease protein [Microlunatus kandeliicorticis]
MTQLQTRLTGLAGGTRPATRTLGVHPTVRFLLRRLGAAVLLLFVLSLVVFTLSTIAPGDPARAYVGANASNAAVAEARARLGLDDPFLVRYARFVGHALTGDLGRSLRTRHPVTADLAAFLPATVELVLTAFVLALVLGALFAVSGALRWPGGAVGRGVLLLLATAPPFLLAIVGVVVFFGSLGWLPAGGVGDFEDPGPFGMQALDSLLHGQADAWADAIWHLALPSVVLAVAPAVAVGRVLRASLDTVLGMDHVRTARSKGLTERRVLVGHVVRNAIGPALSMAGLQLGFMFAGVVVVEQVFSWPGIGNYLAASIPVADFPAIAGVTLVLGAVYVITNTVVDLLQALADPRVSAT